MTVRNKSLTSLPASKPTGIAHQTAKGEVEVNISSLAKDVIVLLANKLEERADKIKTLKFISAAKNIPWLQYHYQTMRDERTHFPRIFHSDEHKEAVQVASANVQCQKVRSHFYPALRCVLLAKCITDLTISMRLSQSGYEQMCEGLSECSSLRRLSFAGSHMGDQRVLWLKPGFLSNLSLEELDVTACALTDVAAMSIASVIKAGAERRAQTAFAQKLREYPDTSLGDGRQARKAFRRRMKEIAREVDDQCGGLLLLEMSENKITDRGALALSDALAFDRRMLALSLRDNDISAWAESEFITLMKHHQALVRVDLRQNRDPNLGILKLNRPMPPAFQFHPGLGFTAPSSNPMAGQADVPSPALTSASGDFKLSHLKLLAPSSLGPTPADTPYGPTAGVPTYQLSTVASDAGSLALSRGTAVNSPLVPVPEPVSASALDLALDSTRSSAAAAQMPPSILKQQDRVIPLSPGASERDSTRSPHLKILLASPAAKRGPLAGSAGGTPRMGSQGGSSPCQAGATPGGSRELLRSASGTVTWMPDLILSARGGSAVPVSDLAASVPSLQPPPTSAAELALRRTRIGRQEDQRRANGIGIDAKERPEDPRGGAGRQDESQTAIFKQAEAQEALGLPKDCLRSTEALPQEGRPALFCASEKQGSRGTGGVAFPCSSLKVNAGDHKSATDPHGEHEKGCRKRRKSREKKGGDEKELKTEVTEAAATNDVELKRIAVVAPSGGAAAISSSPAGVAEVDQEPQAADGAAGNALLGCTGQTDSPMVQEAASDMIAVAPVRFREDTPVTLNSLVESQDDGVYNQSGVPVSNCALDDARKGEVGRGELAEGESSRTSEEEEYSEDYVEESLGSLSTDSEDDCNDSGGYIKAARETSKPPVSSAASERGTVALKSGPACTESELSKSRAAKVPSSSVADGVEAKIKDSVPAPPVVLQEEGTDTAVSTTPLSIANESIPVCPARPNSVLEGPVAEDLNHSGNQGSEEVSSGYDSDSDSYDSYTDSSRDDRSREEVMTNKMVREEESNAPVVVHNSSSLVSVANVSGLHNVPDGPTATEPSSSLTGLNHPQPSLNGQSSALESNARTCMCREETRDLLDGGEAISVTILPLNQSAPPGITITTDASASAAAVATLAQVSTPISEGSVERKGSRVQEPVKSASGVSQFVVGLPIDILLKIEKVLLGGGAGESDAASKLNLEAVLTLQEAVNKAVHKHSGKANSGGESLHGEGAISAGQPNTKMTEGERWSDRHDVVESRKTTEARKSHREEDRHERKQSRRRGNLVASADCAIEVEREMTLIGSLSEARHETVNHQRYHHVHHHHRHHSRHGYPDGYHHLYHHHHHHRDLHHQRREHEQGSAEELSTKHYAADDNNRRPPHLLRTRGGSLDDGKISWPESDGEDGVLKKECGDRRDGNGRGASAAGRRHRSRDPPAHRDDDNQDRPHSHRHRHHHIYRHHHHHDRACRQEDPSAERKSSLLLGEVARREAVETSPLDRDYEPRGKLLDKSRRSWHLWSRAPEYGDPVTIGTDDAVQRRQPCEEGRRHEHKHKYKNRDLGHHLPKHHECRHRRYNQPLPKDKDNQDSGQDDRHAKRHASLSRPRSRPRCNGEKKTVEDGIAKMHEGSSKGRDKSPMDAGLRWSGERRRAEDTRGVQDVAFPDQAKFFRGEQEQRDGSRPTKDALKRQRPKQHSMEPSPLSSETRCHYRTENSSSGVPPSTMRRELRTKHDSKRLDMLDDGLDRRQGEAVEEPRHLTDLLKAQRGFRVAQSPGCAKRDAKPTAEVATEDEIKAITKIFLELDDAVALLEQQQSGTCLNPQLHPPYGTPENDLRRTLCSSPGAHIRAGRTRDGHARHHHVVAEDPRRIRASGLTS